MCTVVLIIVQFLKLSKHFVHHIEKACQAVKKKKKEITCLKTLISITDCKCRFELHFTRQIFKYGLQKRIYNFRTDYKCGFIIVDFKY